MGPMVAIKPESFHPMQTTTTRTTEATTMTATVTTSTSSSEIATTAAVQFDLPNTTTAAEFLASTSVAEAAGKMKSAAKDQIEGSSKFLMAVLVGVAYRLA